MGDPQLSSCGYRVCLLSISALSGVLAGLVCVFAVSEGVCHVHRVWCGVCGAIQRHAES